MISRAAQRVGVDFVGEVTWPGGSGVNDPTDGGKDGGTDPDPGSDD